MKIPNFKQKHIHSPKTLRYAEETDICACHFLLNLRYYRTDSMLIDI